MTKPNLWKVHLAFSYPVKELGHDHIIELQKTELWMYNLELSH